MTKPALYFLPGLAADRRLYNGYKFPDHRVEFLDWVEPLDGESLATYSYRLANKVKTDEPFILIGTSLGGIVAGYMAEVLYPEKVILISSIENSSQFPLRWKIFRYLPLYWLIPFNAFKAIIKLYRKVAGRSAPAEAKVFQAMIENTSSKFFKWAIHQVLWHKKDSVNAPLFQIHGEKDRIFPIKYFKKKLAEIKGADHFMVLHYRKAIQEKINQAISDV